MLRIVPAISDDAVSQARTLMREYGLMPGVAPCVEDFERELSSLPGAYGPPGGRLLLAIQESQESPDGQGKPVGCGALRKWEENTCEMKRLYVRPSFRGQGAGRDLVHELIAQARTIGYSRMVLDTLPIMKDAHKLYESLGFRRIAAYQKKPVPGSLFFELTLR